MVKFVSFTVKPIDNLSAAISMFENLIRPGARDDGCRNCNLMPIAGKRHLNISRSRLPVNLIRSGQVSC